MVSVVRVKGAYTVSSGVGGTAPVPPPGDGGVVEEQSAEHKALVSPYCDSQVPSPHTA